MQNAKVHNGVMQIGKERGKRNKCRSMSYVESCLVYLVEMKYYDVLECI